MAISVAVLVGDVADKVVLMLRQARRRATYRDGTPLMLKWALWFTRQALERIEGYIDLA